MGYASSQCTGRHALPSLQQNKEVDITIYDAQPVLVSQRLLDFLNSLDKGGWGEAPYVTLFSDGSGKLRFGDTHSNDTYFDNLEELENIVVLGVVGE